jgi:hypothetical protein
MTTMGCMVDHIHLDKKYIQHTLPKTNNMQFFINHSFYSDCVHIYVTKLIQIPQTTMGWFLYF